MISNKQRFYRLYQYLYKYTDEQHPVTRSKLMELLSDGDSSYTRHTVTSDIRALIEEGVDVVEVDHGETWYYLGTREFEVPEVKMLIDAVAASRVIPASQTKRLIGKLKGLTSVYEANGLTRNIYTADAVRPVNKETLYTIDAVNEAINRRVRVKFQYADYGPGRRRVLRHKGLWYEVSPYGLVWDHDHYYMVGWSARHDGVTQFRVDRMVRTETTTTRAEACPPDFHMNTYVQQMFQMYGGKTVTADLSCDNAQMNAVLDRFGRSVRTWKQSEETFLAEVEVSDSPTFLAWIFQFCGAVRIEAPESLRQEYADMAEKALHSVL